MKAYTTFVQNIRTSDLNDFIPDDALFWVPECIDIQIIELVFKLQSFYFDGFLLYITFLPIQ